MILADFKTLADIWTIFLDTEWYIFVANTTLEFYNFLFFCSMRFLLLFQVIPQQDQKVWDIYYFSELYSAYAYIVFYICCSTSSGSLQVSFCIILYLFFLRLMWPFSLITTCQTWFSIKQEARTRSVMKKNWMNERSIFIWPKLSWWWRRF